jgi:peptidase C39-like protein
VRRSLTAAVLSGLLLLSAALPAYAALDASDPAQPPASATPPAKAALGPLEFISQTMSNCGPASVAEVLDFWGIHKSQGEVQAVLRADGNPNGMSPFGLPSYVRGLGMAALMGAGGNDALVKGLVSSGFPVIVSQWVSLSDHYGHYRPIEAYDDARGVFVSSDPYLGANHAIGYDEFDKIWASANNRFYVIYPPAMGPRLKAVITAQGWDPASAYMADIAVQQERLNSGQTNGPQGWAFRRGYAALTMAWDNLQLGDIPAAQRALNFARAEGASPIVTNWIASELLKSASPTALGEAR